MNIGKKRNIALTQDSFISKTPKKEIELSTATGTISESISTA
jgi:hypothetical protein